MTPAATGRLLAALMAGVVVATATLAGAAVRAAHAARPAVAPAPAPAPAPARSLASFPDGPPARVTGGFGEDSCAACHFTFDDEPPAGRLDVTGLPACHVKGETYALTVALEDPDMVVAGFQLAVRLASDTSQAGTLSAPDDEGGRVAVLVDRDVAFAQHTLAGSSLAERGTARWRVLWTAPAAREPILLHAAGLAGDGDRSQEGDRAYTIELISGGEGCAT